MNRSCLSHDKIVLVSLLFLLLAPVSKATIYRWKDADGSVVFSDKARGGAERVALPPLNVIPAMHPSDNPKFQSPKDVRSVNYQISFTSPPNGQTYVRGTEPVPVNVQTDQPLQNGDRIYIYMNGSLIGEGYTTAIDTTNLDRGEYSVSAKVLSAANQQMSNEAKTTFNVYQHSILYGKKGK